MSACDGLGPDETIPPIGLQEVPMDSLVVAGPSLVLNPTGITPLSGRLTLATRNPTEVTIEVLGADPVRRTFPLDLHEHVYPVLGLYPDRANRVVLEVRDADLGVARDTFTVSTAPLPDAFPEIEMSRADTARMEPGFTFSGLSLANNGTWTSTPLMFDANGDVRWYADLSDLGGLVFPIKRLKNGSLLVPYGHNIFELDMLGTELNRWRIDGYWQHHEVLEKPDGNLIVAVDVGARETVEDHILELDRTTGSIVREWDIRDVLDVDRRTYQDGGNDWFHMNAIFYVEDEDALIISGRNQGIIKVTGKNELVWILAPHKGWGKAGIDGTGQETADKLLTAVGPTRLPYPSEVQTGDIDAFDFSWTWGQHAPMILPSGNLFVFDNGLARNFDSESQQCSRGVEYEVDEQAMTVRQVWEYGCGRGVSFYSSIISDVDYLPVTGNRLVMPGNVTSPIPGAFVTEVTYPQGDMVFEARLDVKNLNGTGQGWGQMDIVYRSERMPLYPPR